jgi:hypothetical protein
MNPGVQRSEVQFLHSSISHEHLHGVVLSVARVPRVVLMVVSEVVRVVVSVVRVVQPEFLVEHSHVGLFGLQQHGELNRLEISTNGNGFPGKDSVHDEQQIHS